MSGIKDKERLEALRQKLYERGQPIKSEGIHVLGDDKKDVPTSWQNKSIQNHSVQSTSPTEVATPAQTPNPPNKPEPVSELAPEPEPLVFSNDKLKSVKKKKSYRLKLVIIGLIFFVLSVGVSSLFLIRGGNSISGENIAISVTGPFTVGGGEVIPLQVGVTNDNNVSIQSATLIVEYPSGTRSVTEEGKDLYTERLSLDTIASGETLNIPLRAIVFGEENDEKEIKVSIEYRVEGSNALFFKEAEVLRFKISSSPISLRLDNTIKLSSGQETDIKLTVTSNSPTSLSKILVKAEYPNGFDFTRSDPSPSYAENMWVIENLEPESSKTITLTGIVVGRETDEKAINVSVGVPGERDPQNLASVFVTDRVDFVIEQPFLDISMTIDGKDASEVAIEPGQQASVVIEVANTLEDTIYDSSIVVDLSGNALSDVNVSSQNGFYNSTSNTLTWDVGNHSPLEQITPGKKERVTFTLKPSSNVNRTPQIDIDVKVQARRVSENRVAEKLEGTAKGIIKVVSIPELNADVGYNNSVFTDTGPIPPEADKVTTYTLSLMVENGSNELADMEVTASLPPYVTWLNQVSGSGQISVNPTTKVLTWQPGPVEANTSAFTSFQINFLPSQTQIGSTPTLLGEQRLKATDRFTGSVVRNTNSALTTELVRESGYPAGNGRVVE